MTPVPSTAAERAAMRAVKLPRWERDLRRMLSEMEIANGEHGLGGCCDELEMLVRLAWREANRRKDTSGEPRRYELIAASGDEPPLYAANALSLVAAHARLVLTTWDRHVIRDTVTGSTKTIEEASDLR